jgi:PAS domain S-box-containing protein
MKKQSTMQIEGEFISNEQNFLYTSFMNAPAGIAIVKGPTHVYEFANSEYTKIVNRQIQLGKTVYDTLPEIEQQGIIEILTEVFITGEPFVANEYPIELTKKSTGNLELGYYNFVIQPMKDANQQTEGLLIQAIEVTQQVEARKKVEDSEKRFSNLLSQSIMAIAILKGKEMTVAFANDKIVEAWGKGTDVIGKSFMEVLPELKSQGFISIIEQVYNTGIPFYGYESKVVLIRNNKEETLYYNFVYEPYTEVNQTISGITMLATDVTENVLAKKQIEASEAFNRSILQSSPDCIKVLDAEGRIQFMNGNGLCQMEIDEFADISNKVWSSLWGIENQDLVNDAVQKALLGKSAQFIALCMTSKGTPKWWDVRVSPIGKPGEVNTQIISVSRDITEQKNSEEVIKNLASHLKLATESADVGTWSTNMHTKKVEWTAQHNIMWGYDANKADVNFEDWHKVILPEDRNSALESVEHARRNRTTYDTEYRIKRANDGAIRYIRSVGKFIYSAKDASETITGISIDVTEKKVAIEKIKDSENQFRVFADSIQNLAWIADGQGFVYWYNKRWTDYTGLAIEDVQGWEWQKVHHPLHVERVTELLKDLWTKDQPFEMTFPLRRYDGVYRWFLTRVYPVKDANGEIEKWIGTNTDITEQKSFSETLEKKVNERTEELYEKNQSFELAEKIAQFGNYRWNVATGILIYSDNLYRLLDCEPQEFEPSFEKFVTFVHPDDLLQVLNDAEDTLETGQTAERSYRIITKNGVTKYVSTIGNYSGDGQNRSFIGVIQDVTKTVKDAEQLSTKNIELLNLNEELKSFAFIASHDLQEPLRKIQTFSKRILELQSFSDETQHYFNRITATSERMQKLVTSLLDYSSISTTEGNSTLCDINIIFEESKNDLNLIISENKATVEADYLPKIKGHPIQLTQLFTNLIGNAIKYRKTDVTPHITITAKKIHGTSIVHFAANKQQSYYVFDITDNGIGFEQQHSAKIFEPFQRLHVKTDYSGTGIGLAIVKKIVSNHNGFITAESQINAGATFKIYLPIL